MVDVHEYRKAISDDCVVGVCSLNNCLYPHCAIKSQLEVMVTHGHSMLFDKGYRSV